MMTIYEGLIRFLPYKEKVLFSNATSCITERDWDAMRPHKEDPSSNDDYYKKLRKLLPMLIEKIPTSSVVKRNSNLLYYASILNIWIYIELNMVFRSGIFKYVFEF